MRRRTVLAGGLALAASGLLSACAGGGAGSRGHLLVEIDANGSFAPQQRAWFADVGKRFAAATGASVEFETYSSANEELQRVQTSVLSAQGPDVWIIGSTFTPTAYATGSFVGLDSAAWASVGGRDRFVPASLGISGPDTAHPIAVPFSSRPYVMAVNTDLLKQAGITSVATSWDGLTQQAKQLTRGGVHGLAIDYADGYDPWKYIWAMVLQGGQQLVVGSRAHLDGEAVFRAYRRYFDWLVRDHVVDPDAVGWKGAQALAAFAEGRAAMLPMVSAGAKVSLDASPVKGHYAFALMPTIPPGATSLPAGGRAATSIISGDNAVVASWSPNRALAFRLLEMLSESAAQQRYQKLFGDLPTNAQAAAAVAAQQPALAPIVESGRHSVSTPFSGAWTTVQLDLVDVVVQATPDLAKGEVTDGQIRDALSTAQANAQSALDEIR